MSRANAIRKKALDLVRKQNWDGAIKEYKRLAEIDQSNPNVFNELGDLYLKTGNKSDAYDAFLSAIDSYTRVSLHNNAVAVCKKVLRVIPARFEVLAHLGFVRVKQGLAKEAAGHYMTYLEKIAMEAAVDAKELLAMCRQITADMSESEAVLNQVADTYLQHNLKDDAGEVLGTVLKLYVKRGDSAQADALRARLLELGVTLEEGTVEEAPAGAKEGPVITEENIWTEQHSDGDRIQVDDAAPAQEDGSAAVYEYGNVDIAAKGSSARQVAGDASQSSPPANDGAVGVDVEPPSTDESVPPAGPTIDDAGSAEAAPSHTDTPSWLNDATTSADSGSETSDVVHVSAIIDEVQDEIGDNVEDGDFRSHYDLGMAYLEMDLLAESIREFQAASKSPQLQVKSLEMVGLCFLKQNHAKLAIKQLTKGLDLIGENDEDALGIKYNLGLAHEMIGDVEQARAYFEDVYVVDVTFRDVAEKVQKFSG